MLVFALIQLISQAHPEGLQIYQPKWMFFLPNGRRKLNFNIEPFESLPV